MNELISPRYNFFLCLFFWFVYYPGFMVWIVLTGVGLGLGWWYFLLVVICSILYYTATAPSVARAWRTWKDSRHDT
jgi:hypothetical protein